MSKPIDQQLILSIRAPVAKEDLLEIKRPKSSPLFFLEEPEPEPVNKNPWDLAVESIKGKDTTTIRDKWHKSLSLTIILEAFFSFLAGIIILENKVTKERPS